MIELALKAYRDHLLIIIGNIFTEPCGWNQSESKKVKFIAIGWTGTTIEIIFYVTKALMQSFFFSCESSQTHVNQKLRAQLMEIISFVFFILEDKSSKVLDRDNLHH